MGFWRLARGGRRLLTRLRPCRRPWLSGDPRQQDTGRRTQFLVPPQCQIDVLVLPAVLQVLDETFRALSLLPRAGRPRFIFHRAGVPPRIQTAHVFHAVSTTPRKVPVELWLLIPNKLLCFGEFSVESVQGSGGGVPERG